MEYFCSSQLLGAGLQRGVTSVHYIPGRVQREVVAVEDEVERGLRSQRVDGCALVLLQADIFNPHNIHGSRQANPLTCDPSE